MVGSALVLLFLIAAGLLISTVLIARAHSETKAALEREKKKAEEAELQRIRAEADPQILRSLELLPQAKELTSGAQKAIAERANTNKEVVR